MNICNIDTLNKALAADAPDFIRESELLYHRQLAKIAKSLAKERQEHPVVLLAGPSGSGKTSSAQRIQTLLQDLGYDALTVSMDNYFLPLDMGIMPVDENGRPDLESPQRLDAPLFSEHLLRLSDYQSVEMPTFCFKTQRRVESRTLSRLPGQIVIFEGIHALNPVVTGQVDQFANRIYVSVRTRMENAAGELLHPSLIRLARRLIRDVQTRGYSFAATCDNFHSVSRGENLYIMPHRPLAAFDIDSFIPYEMSAYAPLLLPGLTELANTREDARELCNFFSQLMPLDAQFIPKNSIVREFIGGYDANNV